MVWIRTGNLRHMHWWKPMASSAHCSLSGLDLVSNLSQHSAGSHGLDWAVCKMKSLFYAKFRRRLHSANLSLSTYSTSQAKVLTSCEGWLGSSLILWEMGRRREARTELCGTVIWPPAERVMLGYRNLANSFPAGFCTLERIIFPNSSIRKGGII